MSQVAVNEGCGAAIVTDATSKNRTALVTFDLATGTPSSTFVKPLFGPTEGFDLWALAWNGETLFLGDRRRGDTGYPIHRFTRSGAGCALKPLPSPFIVSQKPVALVPLLGATK